MDTVRFRGSIVSSFVSRGWPGNALDVERDRLTLRPLLLEPIVVHRGDAQAVEFRRQRLPFMSSTFIVVRLQHGYLPQMFVALRSGRVRRALGKLGWDVEDGPNITGRDVLFSPKP
jgi:hypothetical protein